MCKDIIKIVSLDDDVIEVKLELTDNIRNLPEIIYEL